MVRKNRKGQLSAAGDLGVGLIILTLIVAVGSIVISDIRTTEGDRACDTAPFTNYNATTNLCDNATGGADTSSPTSTSVNVTTDGLSGLSNMSAQFGTVGTVIIAAVLIALVVAAFVIRR